MKSLLLSVVVLSLGVAEAASMFERDETQDTNAAYLVGEVDVSPLFLERSGEPHKGDKLRVSGYFTFKSAAGVIFTVYDYKSTTVWATDNFGGIAMCRR